MDTDETENKIPLVVVCGPTASGKSKLGLGIAKKINGEIISADSMQLYRYMDIGTAKPTHEERAVVAHHMVDILEPNEQNNVKKYCETAKFCIKDIINRKHIPILVGGTGLYISALVDNINFGEIENDFAYRKKLKSIAKTKGGEYLHGMLKKVDPKSALRLSVNDITRIIRALEVYHVTGITITEHNRRSKLIPSPYDAAMIGLNFRDRDILYKRIDNRVDDMMEKGLVDEVEFLLNKGINPSSTALQAIGYKELVGYFKGNISKDEAISKIKQQTRRYAKRQLTWFRRDKKINWFYCDEYSSYEDLKSDVLKLIFKKVI